MNSTSDRIKSYLAGQRDEAISGHRAGASGFTTCTLFTCAMDEALRLAYGVLPSRSAELIAILALGGYGRAELCPKSDIDIMVLCEGGTQGEDAEKAGKELLHMLWDAGLDIGHSVRTIEDALGHDRTTLDVWASMIESRCVCGNRELAGRFHHALWQRLSGSSRTWFIEGVFAELTARHERYGQSVKLLEPNIKKSAGGLRDFQALFWLFRATQQEFRFPLEADRTAAEVFLQTLKEHGILDEEERGTAQAAIEFMLRARHEMHLRRQSLHDMLEYALQGEVAEGLGFGSRTDTASVETFMRSYYMHARTISRLNQLLSHGFREIVSPRIQTPDEGERVGSIFVLHDGVLGAPPGAIATAEHIMEAFLLCATHAVEPDFRLRAMIEHGAELINSRTRDSEELAVAFQQILRSKRVARTLQQMNELSILGRLIPEFGELVAFFQHSVYHYFTADEHTLIAIANVERLREQPGILREVFRNLKRKDVLYLAILLHDIAKPRSVSDHEVVGVEMAREILRRLRMEEVFPDVAFLIRNHLVMEQVAFRRNIHDRATIREFAEKFERPEQLDYLYLLTYADLSAVNINVWTEWKASLLQELYSQTSEVLRRNLKGVQIDAYRQARQEAAVDQLVDRLSAALPRERIERHLQGISNDSYVALFSEDEIGEHINRSDSADGVSAVFTQQEGFTEVTVIGRDEPFALSRFCAVLAANDANIFDANIFTRDDGVIIDRFRVTDASTGQNVEQRVCTKIASDLRQVMKGVLDVEHLFAAHKRKWRRRLKAPPRSNVRTDVAFEDHPRYTIIDVFAQDALGVLYRITETLSRLGLDIHFAKIGTRMDGIVDAFYVRDSRGNPITDASRREEIKAELLKTIQTISREQLSHDGENNT